MTTLILSLLFSSHIWAAPNKEPSNLLDARIPLFIFSNDDEFFSLCKKLRTPCGEEILPDQPLIQTDYGLRQENASVRTLLDKMVTRRPGYLWEFSDGVLLLRPRSPGVSSPLNNHVGHFVSKAESAANIIDGLARSEWIDLPESHPIVGAGVDIDALQASENRRIDISSGDETLRQMLNATVRAHGHAIWIYTYEPSSAGFIRKFFHRGKLELFVY